MAELEESETDVVLLLIHCRLFDSAPPMKRFPTEPEPFCRNADTLGRTQDHWCQPRPFGRIQDRGRRFRSYRESVRKQERSLAPVVDVNCVLEHSKPSIVLTVIGRKKTFKRML